MRSLFLKIFLWFWTAFVIVGMTLVVVVAITRSNATMLAGLSVYLPFEARQATDIYERDGKPGLQRHFDHLSRNGVRQTLSPGRKLEGCVGPQAVSPGCRVR